MDCVNLENAAKLPFLGWSQSTYICREPENLRRKIGGRLYHAVQVITSLIAIPLILLFGLCSAGFHALNCEGSKAKQDLYDVSTWALEHTFFLIPASLVGIWKNNEEGIEFAGEFLANFYIKVMDRFPMVFGSS